MRRLKKIKNIAIPEGALPRKEHYIILLERFPLFAESTWQDFTKDLGGFGGFGKLLMIVTVRNHTKTLLSYAVLLSSGLYDPSVSGIDLKTIRQHLLKGLYAVIESHISNPKPDAKFRDWHLIPSWGDDWQSSLWAKDIARIAFLTQGILPEDLKKGVERTICFEADRLLDVSPPSGLWDDTKAEELAWDSSILAWARCLYPQSPHAKAWEEKMKEFCMNVYSTYQDHVDYSWFVDRPVRDWVKTINVFPDLTLENHGCFQPIYHHCYDHVGKGYLAYKLTNTEPPPHMLWKVKDVFEVVKRFILWKGRIAFTNGDDWPWVGGPLGGYLHTHPGLFPAALGDPVGLELVRLSFNYADKLQRHWMDGSFYGDSIHPDTETLCRIYGDTLGSYYMEADAASFFASAYLFNLTGQLASAAEMEKQALGTYSYRWIQLQTCRTPHMFASFTWKSLKKTPMGLVIPRNGDSFGGWIWHSLTGWLEFVDAEPSKKVITHNDQNFHNGFTTTGFFLEGRRGDRWLTKHCLAFATLPDEKTALIVDYVKASENCKISDNLGLMYTLENDILNDNKRNIFFAEGTETVQGYGGSARDIELKSNWINVDDMITITAPNGWRLIYHDENRRTAPWASSVIDWVAHPVTRQEHQFNYGETVRIGAYALCCDVPHTEPPRAPSIKTVENGVFVIEILGVDNKTYEIAVNLNSKITKVHDITVNPYSCKISR